MSDRPAMEERVPENSEGIEGEGEGLRQLDRYAAMPLR